MKPHLFDLPQDLLNEILLRLARESYESINSLGKTCHYLKNICDDFVERLPREKFYIPRPPSSSSLDDWGDQHDEYSTVDDIELIVDEYFDRFSYGSNYDEDIADLCGLDDYQLI